MSESDHSQSMDDLVDQQIDVLRTQLTAMIDAPVAELLDQVSSEFDKLGTVSVPGGHARIQSIIRHLVAACAARAFVSHIQHEMPSELNPVTSALERIQNQAFRDLLGVFIAAASSQVTAPSTTAQESPPRRQAGFNVD